MAGKDGRQNKGLSAVQHLPGVCYKRLHELLFSFASSMILSISIGDTNGIDKNKLTK
jgi:hypothetical protein